MKNLMLFSALLILVASCSSNETFEEKILGDWQVYSFVINCDDPAQNVAFTRAEDDGCMEFWGDTQCISLSINPRGKAEITSSFGTDSFTQELSYTLVESREIINVCEEGGDCIEFTLDNNRIVQVMDEDDCLCEFQYNKMD